jgi:type I restriction enzyme M protein
MLVMDYRNLFSALGFSPKENVAGIFSKTYCRDDNYVIEINLENETIDYGEKIMSGSKTTQNFSQPENFVVLECVNRLLEKGYRPENIILEKAYPAGRGITKRLDILVVRDDGTAYLMIECKTCGKEFDRELSRMKKRDGGQLFTYFQQDKNAEILMLYASELKGDTFDFRNEIIKIEDDYRKAGNVEDLFGKWNKLTENNGVWENPPYEYKTEAFTKERLKELTEAEGNKLFNGFASILRKHSVSDKPNAFNVIFNLFLAKLYDEQKRDTDELEFHWRNDDNPVDFQVRLYNLNTKGLNEFLKKEMEGIKDEDFNVKTPEELRKVKKKFLKLNKLFDIKSVLDDNDFDQNHRVLKEVVKLLENYQIRYPRKQRHLSEFFELLLTTGLKQEAGQYFTPSPIAKFIVRSLPLRLLIEQSVNNEVAKLPAVIDYAAGSGHFVTEIMEEFQDIIDELDTENYYPKAISEVNAWKINPYSWAAKYVYGIEKDYRLVKVAKVGCYFYGDGLAQIVHGDGLDSLVNPPKSYVGLLEQNTNTEDSAKNKFSIIVSNPPYSVNDCRDDLEYIGSENEFLLYPYLTDKSKEIECLFVERMKHLLKDGGVAGVILPSSILSNEGIYTKAREIILQYFEIVSVTELGSNTFMATGTNTVILFLRRRSNYDSINLRKSVERFFDDYQDVTRNGIEKPVAKYVNHVWENITFDDYVTLLKKAPNSAVADHEIYREYRKKIKAKTEKDFWNTLIETEKEKLLYFIPAYPQKVVLVKTGEKDAEKRFLGYEFSNRRGSEGIHPVRRGKTIDECTRLFDDKWSENPEKASTYIYRAFVGDYETPIHESLQNNISRVHLVDMLTFDRGSFTKNISTSVRKKVRYEDIWKTERLVLLNDIAMIQKGTSITKEQTVEGDIPVVAGGQEPAYFHNISNRDGNIITVSASGAYSGFVNYFDKPVFASDCNTIQAKDEKSISTKLIYLFLKSIQNEIYGLQKGQAQPHVYGGDLAKIKIPLPSLEVRQKIVSEIEVLEKKEREAKEQIKDQTLQIADKFNANATNYTTLKLSDVCEMQAGIFVKVGDISDNYTEGLFPCYGGNGLRGYTQTYTHEGKYSLVGRQGALCGNVHLVNGKFHATEHALVVTPKQNIDTIWLYHKLIAMNLNRYATGVAQPGLSVMNLTSVLVSVPPLSEQQRTVAEIEQIESEIAEAQKTIDAMPALKNEVLKKYL